MISLNPAGPGQQVGIEWRFTGTVSNSSGFLGWYVDDMVVIETHPERLGLRS